MAFLKQQWIETRLNLGKSIDLYHIHSVTPDSKVLDDPAVIAELETIKKSGIDIGISTSGPDQRKTIEHFIKVNESLKLFNFLQSTINIFDQSCLSVLEEASNQKINIIAKEVFSNGRLTSANENLHTKEIESLMVIAKKLNMSLEELSFLWVYQLPFIKIVLTGASTISQLKENINSLDKKDTQIPNLDEFAIPVDDYWSTRKLLNWN